MEIEKLTMLEKGLILRYMMDNSEIEVSGLSKVYDCIILKNKVILHAKKEVKI